MREIRVFGRALDSIRAYLIAEAGVNHNGEPEVAARMVQVAADAGADCVKFQLFNADSLVRPDAPFAKYQVGQDRSQHEMLSKLELQGETVRQLLEQARGHDIDFLCTPFSMTQARFLVEDLGLDTVKVGSGDLTFTPLLRYLADAGVTVILSTGMATIDEVERAVQDLDGAPTILLHCVSQYPAPPAEANLRAIDELRVLTGDPVGFSDHFVEDYVSLTARALGALVLERHFTLDRAQNGPDHAASMDPDGLTRWVSQIRGIETALGSGVKAPMPSEEDTRKVARRSLVAAKDLDAGSAVTPDDLVALRPADGISPQEIDVVVGKVLVADVKAGSPLSWSDLGEVSPR